MENFICIAKFKAKPEQYDVLEARLKELVKHTQQEDGCIDYDLCHARDSQFDFFVIERYKTKEDFEHHSRQEYLTRFIGDLETLVAGVSVHVCENTKVAA